MTIDANSGTPIPQTECRLCGGLVEARFSLPILQKYDVRFLQCRSCDSLQAENPYWLEEAYSQSLSDLDTGVAQRNLRNLGVCYAVARIFDLRDAIDIGGGHGLLCRLLRDYGINCFVMDRYAQPTFAQGFTAPDFERPHLVLAFEVLEHYVVPRVELAALFEAEPAVVLVSTGIYADQGEDWWYISPESGQHIFFYSEKSLREFGDARGYEVFFRAGYSLFAKRTALSFRRRLLLRLAFKDVPNRLVRAWLAGHDGSGAWSDHDARIVTHHPS